MNIFGKEYSKKELLAHLGNLDQVAYIRPNQGNAGKEFGLKMLAVKNGLLDFTVLEGRCLDIFDMHYKGVNLSFISKSGLTSQLLQAQLGEEGLRSLTGGLMYTCGLSNVGPDCVYKGQGQAFHGRMRMTAAENVAVSRRWEGDDLILEVGGEMRESQLFREDLVLRRTITTRAGEKSVLIKNEVENLAFTPREIMLMFHINPGFPILDEGSELIAQIQSIVPRNEVSAEGLKNFSQITMPVDGRIEEAYYLKIGMDDKGDTAAAFVNDRLKMGVYIEYNNKALPEFIYWKAMGSGDYAVGIEPSNCIPEGIAGQSESGGKLVEIAPFEKLQYDLRIGVLDGEQEIEDFRKRIAGLNNQ